VNRLRPHVALGFLLLVGLYLAGAMFGELLLQGPDRVTLVWLPAGVSLAALLLYGRRWWPFIPLAEVLYQSLPSLTGDPTPQLWLLTLFTAAANTVGALLGATVARHLSGADAERFVLRSGAALLVGALALAVSSGLLGVSGLVLSGFTPTALYGAALLKWTIANFFGVVLIAPAVLLASRASLWARDPALGYPFARLPEQLAWAAALFASSAVLIVSGTPASPYALGLVSLPLAVLAWSALRFSPLYPALASLLVGLALATCAGLGIGVFVPPATLGDSVMLLLFLSMVAVMPLLLAAAVNENRLTTLRLLRRARTDDLTGLPNRAGFEAEARLLAERGGNEPMALAYLDLDNFKLVNDTAGHSAGDEMLKSLAGLLRTELRADDLLARLGGDEFAVLLRRRLPLEAERVAERLRDAVAEFRHPHGGHLFAANASIGLVPFLPRRVDYSVLLAQADAACFTAKELGGSRVQTAESGAHAVTERTTAMRWAMRLSTALEQDHFRLYCQSIVPLHPIEEHGRHFEMLIRLYDPEHDRILAPGQFVPAAERFRMGPRLDRYVIDRTLRWLEDNPRAAAEVAMCSINLCAASVDDDGFLRFLRDRLAASPLPAEKLCFEITETSAVRDLGDAQRFIDGVRRLGCRLALDDFGTGFCSFAYLKALDVDYFKIDGSFVREIDSSPLSLSIVRAIADIARGIDKRTIAEFVETPQIRARLAELGVDYAQGYAIDEPQPIERYFARLRSEEVVG
jgi:diguanylate cyclase (GGDEF)-like protein